MQSGNVDNLVATAVGRRTFLVYWEPSLVARLLPWSATLLRVCRETKEENIVIKIWDLPVKMLPHSVLHEIKSMPHPLQQTNYNVRRLFSACQRSAFSALVPKA
jgi:hypothetical protein